MGGGEMQLSMSGKLDTYLTGNPQICFFKAVYRKHTNFSMESIEQMFQGNIDFEKKITANIPRSGDLVMGMYLEASIELASGSNVYANVGSALIDNINIEIGNQIIDTHYGHWLETYAELTQPNSKHLSGTIEQNSGGHRIQGTPFQNMSGMGGVSGTIANSGNPENIEIMFIPLQFWFCRSPGLALPLISLQYHEVNINLTLGKRSDIVSVVPTELNISLWVDYVFLDTNERRKFAQSSHEYLIEQVQFQPESTSNSFILDFKHAIKEIIWIGTPSSTATTTAGPSTPNVVRDGIRDTPVKYKLVFNGQDRFAARDYKYFTRMQIYKYHSGCGGLILTQNSQTNNLLDTIAVYSFALKPEDPQPSGTCNFSRINDVQLKITQGTSKSLYIYAVNYNILRIISGMCGLAYSELN